MLLDRELRGTRFYQTALLPAGGAVAWPSPASSGSSSTPATKGLTQRRDSGAQIDWYGDPKYNLWAVMVATGWQHTGYIMLLYLAGLKSVDPALREAAAVDGASQWSTFFRVVLPVLRPINLIVLVVTMITSLRLFDLVWVINKGRNGLELIAALVTQNIIGEASRVGFGSALATIMLLISSVFVVIYLNIVFRDAKQ